MFAITHCWIDNMGDIPEAKCSVIGLYENIIDARKGLNLFLMKLPDNDCGLFKSTDEEYYFLSPDGKTRGCIEIKEIKK